MDARRITQRNRIARGVALATVLGLALAACGRLSGTGSGSPPPTGSPSQTPDAGLLVFRVNSVGGFVAPQLLLLRLPTFSLYADGTVITEGAQTEIYPQRSLPPLIATHVSRAGVQAIIRAAQAAGLVGPDKAYNGAIVADAPSTVFTLIVDGHRTRITVNALGSPAGTMTAPEARARAALEDLSSKLTNLRPWLPAGSVGKDTPYIGTALRIFVTDGAPQDGGGTLHEPDVEWPLATPLASFGIFEPLPSGPVRCGSVEGADLAKLMPKIESSNQLTPWVSDGKSFGLAFRPLLPDESGC
jgi:hypothetical protein